MMKKQLYFFGYAKHTFTLLAVTGMLLMGCGGGKAEADHDAETETEEHTSVGDVVGGLKNMKTLADQADGMEALQKKLTDLTPLENDQLKAMLPEELLGIKRSAFAVGDGAAYMKIKTAEATYKKSDGSGSIELSIMDGAGEVGASVVALQYMALSVDSEKETADGFEKNIAWNGHRAHLEQRKNGDEVDTELSYLVDDRFLVKLEGEHVSVEDLQKAAATLDVKE